MLVTARRCEAEVESRCVVVFCLLHSGGECACRRDQAPAGAGLHPGAAMELRLIETQVESAYRRDQKPAVGLPSQRSRHRAPADRGMLATATQCEAEAEPRYVVALCLWHSRGEWLPPPPPPAESDICLRNGAAMKLRLIEQACGCSTVRGSGRVKVRGRLLLLALGWRVRATTTRHLQVVCLGIGTTMELRLIEACFAGPPRCEQGVKTRSKGA